VGSNPIVSTTPSVRETKMPGEARSRRARLRRSLAVVGIAAGTVLALAAPAFADDPPGWTSPSLPPGQWVAFTVDNPTLTGRSTYGPVTLTRVGPLSGADLQAAFSNWDVQPNPPNPDNVYWPLTFDSGTAKLQRAQQCDFTQSSCQYTVVQAGSFTAAAGNPVDGSGNPDTSQFPGTQTITVPPPKVLHVGFSPDVHPTPGVVGQPGHITLDASGFTSDELDPSGTLSYSWVVVNVADPTKTFTSNIGPQVQLDINQDATYCVQLTVTAAVDGFSASTPACAPGNPNNAPTFIATDFAPKLKQKDPTPSPTPPAGGGGTTGGGTGGGGFGGITFSNPQRRAPAVLSSAGLSSPAVVWLWRPDFYKPTPEATTGAPITTNTPNLKGRHEIVVTRPGPSGASAGPWLAGMGVFGLAGGGWVVSRRRRLRLLELEP
jgi:hypothetical protein